MTTTDHQLDAGTPVREAHAPRLKFILVTLLLLGLGGGSYYAVAWYQSPAQVLYREMQALSKENDQLLIQQNQDKLDLEASERRTAEIQKRMTENSARREAISAEKTKLANTGVVNPAPIAPLADAPQ